MIAKNFDEFVEVMSAAERKALNNEYGQKLTKELLKMKLDENPNLTPEEWQQTKSEFMTFLFYYIVKENPDLMHELGGHVYDELRKEN